MAPLFDSADAAKDERVNVDAQLANADKFVRSQPVAAAWNAGRVLLPHEADWLEDFSAEVGDFTGVNDRHDDMVDALAAAFDALGEGVPVEMPRTFASKFSAGSPFTKATFQR